MRRRSTLLAAVTLAFAAPAAHAQRPVITENAEEPGRVPYRESQSPGCPVGFIRAEFAAVPAGKRLVVTFVSGLLDTYDSLNKYLLIFPATNPAGAQLFVPETVVGGQGSIDIVAVSSPISTYFDPGEVPVLSSSCVPGTAGTLTLIGYYVSVP